MNKSAVANAGFVAVKRSPKRLIASIQGPVKSGKTRLALTGRKPCGYIAVEVGGDEGVVDQFIPQGADSTEDIQIAKIRMGAVDYPNPEDYRGNDRAYQDALSEAVQGVAGKALDEFYAAYYASIENFELTVVDTGSDLWEIARLANFGRLEKIPQLAYAQLNKSMDKLIDDAYSCKGSVIFTHHMKEVWESFTAENGKQQGRPSGRFDMAGYGGIKKKVQAVIELWREDLEESNEDGLMVNFNAMIVDSRHNPYAMGQKFSGEFTLADIGTAIVGGSKKADWA